jgi:hypothetical protein
MLSTRLFEEMKRHEKKAHHITFDRLAFAASTLPNIVDTANHNLNTPQRSSFCGINVWGTPRSNTLNTYLPSQEMVQDKF